tara:strand:- start:1412 stop:1723 length:312 start_codon:yes stop_codon:yes gene_type:complete
MNAEKLHSPNTLTEGTSFHGQTIYTSVEALTTAYGEPSNYGDPDDKVQYEWDMELQDGTVFTIYDWKEYRCYEESATIEFHIGAKRGLDAIKALKSLKQKLRR